MKLFKKINDEIKIYKTEDGEFIVRKRSCPDADYFTDDKEDAIGTANLMAKKLEAEEIELTKPFSFYVAERTAVDTIGMTNCIRDMVPLDKYEWAGAQMLGILAFIEKMAEDVLEKKRNKQS